MLSHVRGLASEACQGDMGFGMWGSGFMFLRGREDPGRTRGSQMSGRRVLDVLKGLPLDDRLAVLVLSIVESNPAAGAIGIRMAEVTGQMSERLGRPSRYPRCGSVA